MYSGKTSAMLRALRSARLSGAFSIGDHADGGVKAGSSPDKVSAQFGTASVAENIVVVKSEVDTRSPEFAVVSRDNMAERGPHVRAVASLDEIDVAPGAMIACDEAQFFSDGSLLRLWDRVRKARGVLLVSGLDTDFHGRPFGDVLKLATAATAPPHPSADGSGHAGSSGAPTGWLPDAQVEVHRLVSKCAVCGAPASLTARVSPASEGWINRFTGPGGPAGRHAPLPDQSVRDDLVVVGDKDAYRAVCRAHHCGGQLVRESDHEDSMLLGSADGSCVFVESRA
jgi:thymidine kinase